MKTLFQAKGAFTQRIPLEHRKGVPDPPLVREGSLRWREAPERYAFLDHLLETQQARD
jgi:hypothetical protein